MSNEEARPKVRRQGRRLDDAQREWWALVKDIAVLAAAIAAAGLLAYFGWHR
jgi:hypothetical protein